MGSKAKKIKESQWFINNSGVIRFFKTEFISTGFTPDGRWSENSNVFHYSEIFWSKVNEDRLCYELMKYAFAKYNFGDKIESPSGAKGAVSGIIKHNNSYSIYNGSMQLLFDSELKKWATVI